MLRNFRRKTAGVPLVIRSAQYRCRVTDAYLNRHIGPNKKETEDMLKVVGKNSLQELVHQIIPAEAIRPALIHPFRPQSEIEVLSFVRSMGSQNRNLKNMIGQGYYECIVPPALTRNVLENPMWYTPYVPVHPEVSQGRLEALLTFQTVVSELTSMDFAGASSACEATACSEAMGIAFHYHKKERKKFLVSSTVFSSSIANMKTRAESLGIEIVVFDSASSVNFSAYPYAGLLVQTPSADGSLHNYSELFKEAQQHRVICCCATDLMACTVTVPPGEMGADVVVGSAQRFGMPLGYGGPHAAFIALRDKLLAFYPGHLVGLSHDEETSGPAVRLVLRERETYFRKEAALSNIDTAPFLPACMAAFYAMYHGAKGLRLLGVELHSKARTLAAGLKCLELSKLNSSYCDTITLKLDPMSSPRISAAAFAANCEEKGVNISCNKEQHTVSISVDECTTDHHLSIILEAAGMKEPNLNALRSIGNLINVIPEELVRTSSYLSGMVFQSYKSETEMMRYVQRLQRKDFGLTHGMMPMGSCTMKLNSAVVVRSMHWPEYSWLHPYAPEDQTRGITTMIVEFKQKMCDIFGMAACSIQPNSAAQGLYAGLRIVQTFYQSQGVKRKICLIPSLDSGTNAASATLAGFQVVYLSTTSRGLIDMNDLEEKCRVHGPNVAAIMMTYPSVCGVFDVNIIKIIEIIHGVGGQCFIDGIHMNAMVGYTGPGFIGGDVCTIPLHKTFAIPHASGGAGIGSIVVRQHLAPFLPNSVVGPKVGGSKGYGVVSQSGYGSASMVGIPHALIMLLGSRGLKTCTDYSILNANYLRKRLEKEYKVHAIDCEECCAHQFVLDVRGFRRTAGIFALDIAKRLIDYGFHPPTVNLPFEGSLLIEPTESEGKAELDRFADALLCIRKEIRQIECGDQPRDKNVLKEAPHTAKVVTADIWDRPYSRQTAAYPSRHQYIEKYWPAVGRVDKKFGDSHPLCTCTPLEFYQ